MEEKKLKHQLWQTVILAVIAISTYFCEYTVFQLPQIMTDASPRVAGFILIVFTIVIFVLADSLWSLFGKIQGDFWSDWLAGTIFFLAIISGLVAFGVFVYIGCIFWWEDVWSLRFIPVVFGVALFLTFIYKVFFGFKF